MLRTLCLTCFLVLLTSCASHDDRLAPADGEQLLEEFGLDQAEKDKFSFEEIKPTPIPSAAKSRNKKISNPIAPVQVVVKEKEAVAPKPTPKVVAISSQYPEDYPEEYIELYEPAKKTWQQFSPVIRVGEVLRFDVSYLGIKAGTITFTVLENGKRGDDTVNHFKATLSSADYYKYIYRLDDYVESFILANSFMPLKYTLIQRESGQSVDDLQLFDHEARQSKQWLKKVKDGKTRRDDKVAFIPPLFLDPLALLSFFRGLPLKEGDEYFIPVIVRSKLWRIYASVEKREVIEVLDEDRPAVKLKVRAESIEEKKKPTTMNLWYADQPSRELLRFNAELKFGSVEGELVDE